MANRKDVFGVEITGDITGLKNAMAEATKVFNSTERALKNINKELAIDPTSTEAMQRKAATLQKDLKDANQALRDLKKIRKEIENDPNFLKGDKQLQERYSELALKIAQVTKRHKELKEEIKDFSKVNTSTEKYKQKYDKLMESFKTSKSLLDEYRKSLANVDAQIKENPNNAELYEKRQRILNDIVSMGSTAVKNYKKNLSELTSDPNHIKFVSDLGEEFTATALEIEKITNEVERLNRYSPKIRDFLFKVGQMGEKWQLVGQELLNVSNNARALSVAFQKLAKSAFDSSVDYEKEIANIRRVVSDLTDETVKDLKTIAVETGNTFSDIAEYATIAGALGIAEKDIAEFAKTMVDINTATGGAFSGEEGAKAIYVFLNNLGLGVEMAENFGSAIAVIGDKYADIGDETVKLATSMIGLSTSAKVSQYDLIGLAGIMSDLGLSSESSSSAITRSFLAIENAIAGTTKKDAEKLEAFARTSGMTASEFKKAWGEGALDTFLKFVDGLKGTTFDEINDAISRSSSLVNEYAETLGWSASYFKKAWGEDAQAVFKQYVAELEKLDDSGTAASSALKQVGLSGVRSAETLLRLSGFGNDVRRAIQEANVAWNENTALMEKSGGIYDTTERKLQGFMESLNQLKSSFIDGFLPTIKDAIDSLTSFMGKVNDLNPNTKQLIALFVGLGASFAPVTKAMGSGIKTLGLFARAQAGLLTKTEALNVAVTMASLKITAIIGLIGALAIGVKKLDDFNKESIKQFTDLSDKLETTKGRFAELTQELSNNAYMFDYNASMERQSVESQIHAINALIGKRKDKNLTDKESSEIASELTKKVKELNEALGEDYDYNSKKNTIQKEGKDVDDLIGKYEKLSLEQRKAFYLEESQSAYNQALNDAVTAQNAIIDAKWEYNQAIKDYDDELIAFAERLAENKNSVEVRELLKSLNSEQSAIVSNIANLYLRAKGIVDESQKIISDSNALRSNVDIIAKTGTDQLEYYLDLIKHGWNIDPAKNDLAEIEEKIEKLNFILKNPEGVSLETLTQAKDELALLESLKSSIQIAKDEADKLTEAQEKHRSNQILIFDEGVEKNREAYEGSGGIISTSEASWDEIERYIKEKNTLISDDYKTKIENANDSAQAYLSANPLYQTVIVSYRNMGGGSYPSGPYTSGGFGFNSMGFGDLLSNSFDVLRRSFSNIKLASGGYSNRSVVVSPTFNINTTSASREDVRQWSQWLLDDINDGLGRAI